MKTLPIIIIMATIIISVGCYYNVNAYNNLIESNTIHVSHTFEITPKKGTTHLEIHQMIKAHYQARFFGIVKLEYEQKKQIIPVTSTEPVKITVEGEVPSVAIWKAKAFVYYWDKSDPTKEYTIGYMDYRTPWYSISRNYTGER